VLAQERALHETKIDERVSLLVRKPPVEIGNKLVEILAYNPALVGGIDELVLGDAGGREPKAVKDERYIAYFKLVLRSQRAVVLFEHGIDELPKTIVVDGNGGALLPEKDQKEMFDQALNDLVCGSGCLALVRLAQPPPALLQKKLHAPTQRIDRQRCGEHRRIVA
jgi:hypothetical protein